jgi:hypothetical protein
LLATRDVDTAPSASNASAVAACRKLLALLLCLTLFNHELKDLLFAALSRFFIKNGAQTVTIKPQAKAMLHSKSCDFWFALIPVVGPNTAKFLFVNGAVFRRL